jgi:hypothetical protein
MVPEVVIDTTPASISKRGSVISKLDVARASPSKLGSTASPTSTPTTSKKGKNKASSASKPKAVPQLSEAEHAAQSAFEDMFDGHDIPVIPLPANAVSRVFDAAVELPDFDPKISGFKVLAFSFLFSPY